MLHLSSLKCSTVHIFKGYAQIAKILVTGASGFVGSHILETLSSIKHSDIEVVAACRDASKLIPQYSGEVRVGDLRDPEYLDRVLAGVDIICHAAGWSSFENSGKQCSQAYLEPTMDLINRAIEWRVRRFVNLSSLYVSTPRHRNNVNMPGKPRRHWPMINCLIAVESFLNAYAENNVNSRCQFINLRVGLYSGKRLNMGLLPLLLARSGLSTLPYMTGPVGHLPLTDGRDIGQAFVRAALAPGEKIYQNINIAGPSTPSHSQVMNFIAEQIQQKPLAMGMPAPLASSLLWLQGKTRRIGKRPLFTAAMLDLLKSPPINNSQAIELLGYDPEISWQASLLDTLELHKNQLLNDELSQQIRTMNIH